MSSDNKGNKGNSNSEHGFMKMVHNHQHFVRLFILYFQARVKNRLKLSPEGRVLPMMAYTEKLRPKGVSFSGFRYMKG